MRVDDRIIGIIEDHESIVQTIDAICCALENDTPMPQYIPVLNDLSVTDHLCKICEALNKMRHEDIQKD